jgi:hypothetical protein
MTDHPAAEHLLMMAARPQAMADAMALEAGAAALRALAQFRPHHPNAVVAQTYAVLTVPWQAVLDARAALGDFDLGRFDLEAARAAVQRDREDHFDEMGRDALRAKWGARL